MLEHPSFRPKVRLITTRKFPSYSLSRQIFHTGFGPLAGTEDRFPGPDNPSKMRRSVENAEHVGVYSSILLPLHGKDVSLSFCFGN